MEVKFLETEKCSSCGGEDGIYSGTEGKCAECNNTGLRWHFLFKKCPGIEANMWQLCYGGKVRMFPWVPSGETNPLITCSNCNGLGRVLEAPEKQLWALLKWIEEYTYETTDDHLFHQFLSSLSETCSPDKLLSLLKETLRKEFQRA